MADSGKVPRGNSPVRCSLAQRDRAEGCHARMAALFRRVRAALFCLLSFFPVVLSLFCCLAHPRGLHGSAYFCPPYCFPRFFLSGFLFGLHDYFSMSQTSLLPAVNGARLLFSVSSLHRRPFFFPSFIRPQTPPYTRSHMRSSVT